MPLDERNKSTRAGVLTCLAAYLSVGVSVCPFVCRSVGQLDSLSIRNARLVFSSHSFIHSSWAPLPMSASYGLHNAYLARSMRANIQDNDTTDRTIIIRSGSIDLSETKSVGAVGRYRNFLRGVNRCFRHRCQYCSPIRCSHLIGNRGVRSIPPLVFICLSKRPPIGRKPICSISARLILVSGIRKRSQQIAHAMRSYCVALSRA